MAQLRKDLKVNQLPSKLQNKHEPTSNIIFNLAQMGIPLKDAFFIEIDTYFELLDLFQESMSGTKKPTYATQQDIDRFLY